MATIRSQTTNYTYRRAVKQLGDKCVNCGSSDRIEYHHIVPVCVGGTNSITNIVPLCRKCHLLAHSALPRKAHAKQGGRHRKPLPDDYLSTFEDYFNAVIGSKEFCERLGTGKHACEVEEFKAFLEERGVTYFRSMVDYYDKLHRGERCVCLGFADGSTGRIFYYPQAV